MSAEIYAKEGIQLTEKIGHKAYFADNCVRLSQALIGQDRVYDGQWPAGRAIRIFILNSSIPS